MSDPLSVAGTAVGITSLGIQVCQGLIEYLRAVRGRKEEIRDGVREVEQVVSLLYSLNNTLSNVNFRNGTNSLRTCARNCYMKLEELQKLLGELCGTQSTNKATKKASDVMRAVSYPFRQEKLSTIRDSLRSVLNDLGLIVSIISLDSNASVHDTVNDVSKDLKDHAKSHDDHSIDLQSQIHRNSVQLQSLHTAISDTLSDIQEQLHQTQISIQDLSQQINGKLTIVESGTRSIEASNHVTIAKLEKLTQAVEFQTALMSSMDMQVTDTRRFRDEGAVTTCESADPTVIRNDISPVRGAGMRPLQGCYCATAVPKSMTFFRFWNFNFLFEEQEHHLPTCKLWGTRKGTKLRARAEFLLKLSWTAAHITSACFEYTSGTSRPGISIRCKNIVPLSKSPVYMAISDFTNEDAVETGMISETITKLKSLEHKILTLYSKGLASPLDTDQYGRTHTEILLKVCSYDIFTLGFSARASVLQMVLQDEILTYTFTSCVRTLLQANECQLETLSGIELLLHSKVLTKLKNEPNNVDYFISSLYANSYFPFSKEIVKSIADSKPTALLTSMIRDSTDLSPITKSILSRSISDLASCVTQSPESVFDCVFGLNVVQLSVAWPEGLRYLLTTKASILASEGNEKYRFGILSRAIQFDHVESVDMLLEAGFCPPNKAYRAFNMSWDMATVVASHISLRRLRLLKFSQTQLGMFLCKESVAFADSVAAKICDAVNEANLWVEPCLRVQPDYLSIYLDSDLPLDAFKLLWQQGFRHVDCHDHIGRTPIMTYSSRWLSAFTTSGFQHKKKTIMWLARHGFMQARAKDSLNIGFNMFAAGFHYIGAQLANHVDIYNLSHTAIVDRTRFMVRLTSHMSIEDDCTCWCNAEGHGCSPTKVFLKTYFLPVKALKPTYTADTILHCQTFTSPDSDELSIIAKEALRLLTFEALDMTHTCCFFDQIGNHDPCHLVSTDIHNDWAIFSQDPDRVLEIRSDINEQDSAALLENLMSEFVPQVQIFNPSSLAFEGFIRTFWRRRISQLYSPDPVATDVIRQYQIFKGFGVPSSSRIRALPNNLHRFLGKDFILVDTHDSTSEQECAAEVSRYFDLQCEGCSVFEKFEESGCGCDFCKSGPTDND